MLFSKFFIDRPIFATVLAILMVVAGGMTVFTLPVSQYPDITPPTVMVSASYPGADATTVAENVGVPIEQSVNGVDGMLYMSSNSGSDGSYSLTVTFAQGTDLDQAAVDVQNRVSEAETTLPTAVKEEGISVNKNSSNQVLFLALQAAPGSGLDALYLTNYAQLNLIDPLTRVPGVGGVTAFGGGEYSMRVWLNPSLMAARGLSPSEVESAIRVQNMEVSAGSVGDPKFGKSEFEYTLSCKGRLTSPEEFGEIIVRNDSRGIIRLKDVAQVELGSESYSQYAAVDGEQSCLIVITQLPGANALDVADGALAEMENLSRYFPEGVSYNVVQNSTDFVRASMKDVVTTFILTSLIVMVVIIMFLQNWRAVVIPMLTIPVSLIATFAVMKLMGFSLNTLTLFGLVLAIAIVVDDAIVVVEDCTRIVDEGKMNARQAAVQAMKELTGPVVGEVLVLMSVFIPTAFISGITGQLYKQFALTIAVSTAFSGFNALTLTPALCALFLTPQRNTKFFLFRWFNIVWAKVEKGYQWLISKMLLHPYLYMLLFLALSGLGIWGYVAWPSSYIPSEDMGYFMTSVQLPQEASLNRTNAVVDSLSAEIRRNVKGVKNVMQISGFSFIAGGAGSNLGILMVELQPWSERGKDESVDRLIEQVDMLAMEKFPEAQIFSVNPPAIPGLGVEGGLQMQLLDINNLGAMEMKKAIAAIEDAARDDKRLASVTSMYEGETPQYQLKVDRDRVASLGIDLEEVYSAISSYLGSSYVDDFIDFGRSFQVIVKGNAAASRNIGDLRNLRVKNSAGEMVPLEVFTSIVPAMGQSSVNRYNMYQTASLTANAAKGVSSSEAIQAMEEIVEKAVGKNYSYAWTGEAYQETQATTTISFVFVFAIIMTLLVLAAQYESWTDPVAVVMSMPVAILGTVLGCVFMSQSVSIYTQIGLILLLGMSAKNAILIVEYAMDFRKAGVDIRKAAHDAGVIRFRPIMMTACAFVFGVMPMMFATGAGAHGRQELGTAVVFGMALNAIIGTTFVPVFWEILQNFNEKYLSRLIPNKKLNSTTPDPTASPSATTGDDPAVADI
ncbi:MAG: efflux RND transporter permease subunit [Muribaculaceae bacterium]|nr:efflux RND transporter permease subunit [Muribaculaceae bacterium]